MKSPNLLREEHTVILSKNWNRLGLVYLGEHKCSPKKFSVLSLVQSTSLLNFFGRIFGLSSLDRR